MSKTGKKRKETFRLKRLCSIEEEIQSLGFERIAGVDEAGRGPLAGPLVAAACILPEGYVVRGINDSKKLTAEQRYRLYQDLILHPEIDFGIGVVEAAEIDRLNIHQATLCAMVRAVGRLKQPAGFLLVDGPHTPDAGIPAQGIIHGDSKVQAICAASILAKVTRDHIMIGYHELYPQYGFKEHKGYGTSKHRQAIANHGTTPIHRMSFIHDNPEEERGELDDQEHDSICAGSE